jgi:hypothetical protein
MLSAAAAGFPESITIDHQGPGCLVAEQFPRLIACLKPASAVARARIEFRAQGGPHWYSVDMKPDAPCYVGILPKPKKTTARIEYHIEAIDRGFATTHTQDFQPQVVPDAGSCQKDVMVAGFLPRASVLVSAPPGAPPFPEGFVGASAGPAPKPPDSKPAAVASATPAPVPAAGSGGHISTAALVAGGAVAAGGGLALVLTSGGGESGDATAPPAAAPNPPNAPSTPAVAAPNALTLAVSPPLPALAAATQLTFTAQSSGNGVTYSWDFGDGGAASGPSVTHAYAAAGTFTVKVTATNAGGSAAGSALVTVRSLTGAWDYLLSNGFQDVVNIVQAGSGITGSGQGYSLSGTVADARQVRFGVQAGSCNESFTGNADAALDVIQGPEVSCTGQTFTLTLRRR